jgi:glycerol-3-phosphate dehydrogenase
MNRNSNISKLKTETFDVCIIGAGASGAGVALDAALRGLKVALIDRGDFCSETSAKSTKLIHGGVRYLEQAFKNLDFAQLKQVNHGLKERKYLLQNAPHLAQPLGIITPVFSWIEGLYYTIGLKLYGLFATNDSVPKAEWISKKETLERCPDLNPKINSAVIYYDGQLDDTRFCLALCQSAHDNGTTLANYVEIKSFSKSENGKIEKAIVNDNITNEVFEIKSKIFVNCTGPFSDHVRLMANPTEENRIQPSKGVHIIIPKRFFKGTNAMLIPKTKDGRLVFVIPFKNEIMVGTTDTPANDVINESLLEDQEADFLLETLERFLKINPTKKDIKSGFGGLRPLLSAKTSKSNETKTLLRDHEIEIDEESGLISLMGGKWTTYRLMAQDTVDKVSALLGNANPCKTHEHILWGGTNLNNQLLVNNLPNEVIDHLKANYGNKANEIIEISKENKDLKEKLHADYPFIFAEVAYACRYEMAEKPRDFFARRIRLELLNWEVSLQNIVRVCKIMKPELNWTDTQLAKEIEEYTLQIQLFINKVKS